MRTISAPPVAYRATADRPAWGDLPAPVRAVIEDRLGGPVVAVTPAGAGFTRGFAALVTAGGGTRAFIKASSVDYLVDAYRREAAITAALPAAVPAARPLWTASVDDWFALALDPIDGHVPGLPWVPAELDAALGAWATAASALGGWAAAASALAEPGGLAGRELPSFADLVAADLTTWRDVVAHRAPLPAMPRYGRARLAELAALEAELAIVIENSRPGLMHGDLRLDNVLIDGAGSAWLCDWNHLCRGPAWFDTVTLLISAYASGLDASALFLAHPTAPGPASSGRGSAGSEATGATRGDGAFQAPEPSRAEASTRPAAAAGAEALEAALAGIAGFWLRWADRESEASPSVGPHRRWSGEVALAWLADRRGWP